MICGYCRAKNSDEEHRCVRCGRRLHYASPRPAPETYPVIHGAAAPEFQARPEAVPVQPPSPPPPSSSPSLPPGGIQASLFGPQPVPRLLEMPPARPAKPAPARRIARKSAAADQQQSLDLLPPLETRSPDAVVQCAAPVAPRILRVLAAAVDGAVTVSALGLFLGALSFGGVDVVVQDKVSLIVYAVSTVLIGLLYRGFFVIGNSDTIGVRALRMRVVNFDGNRPTPRQRLYRFAGGCLSVLAASLGLLWAMVDEESLTWHDHISKTFPTAAS